MSKQPIVKIRDFSKAFGSKQVIKDLSFEVGSGEVFAFLGANGSGKTTTLRCLLGIYEADKGSLKVKGHKYQSSMSAILGYMPEERGLYLNGRVKETLIYFAELKGVSRLSAHKRATDYLQRVELASLAESKIKNLSSGQQQKIQIGTAVINNPELLILDEPTKGLDPINRQLLLELLEEHNRRGATIIFSTHIMEEVEEIADRLVMIKDGQRRLYGEVNKVKREFGSNTIHLKFSGKLPTSKLYTARSSKYSAELRPADAISSDQILAFLASHKDLSISNFDVSSPSLREIFVQLHGEEAKL